MSTNRSRCKDETLADRLWSKVDRSAGNDACWMWSGATYPFGYGCIGSARGLIGSHIAAWQLTNGPVPSGMCVLHRCDQPRCCNPAHLFLGTKRDNAIDRNQKGRGKWPVMRGDASPNAKVTEDDVRVIRGAYGSLASIGRAFGISETQVRRIRRGERWGHLA